MSRLVSMDILNIYNIKKYNILNNIKILIIIISGCNVRRTQLRKIDYYLILLDLRLLDLNFKIYSCWKLSLKYICTQTK